MKLAEGDTAHQVYKRTQNVEDLRHVKNLRNEANHYILRERFKRKPDIFK